MATYGGKREGAGKPKGSMNKKTVERKQAEEMMRQMILKKLTPIVNAQIQLAQGCTYLYRIDEILEDKKKTRKHVLVEDPREIEEIMNATDGEAGSVGDNYYYLTTKSPENKAIDSLVDRVFGKAKQSMEITGDEDKPLVVRQIEAELKSWASKK